MKAINGGEQRLKIEAEVNECLVNLEKAEKGRIAFAAQRVDKTKVSNEKKIVIQDKIEKLKSLVDRTYPAVNRKGA